MGGVEKQKQVADTLLTIGQGGSLAGDSGFTQRGSASWEKKPKTLPLLFLRSVEYPSVLADKTEGGDVMLGVVTEYDTQDGTLNSEKKTK